MTDRSYPDRPRVGVLAVVRRAGHVLLVQRSKPPRPGLWGFPGGEQELGETVFETASRELLEETGIVASALDVLTVLDHITRDEADRIQHHWTLVVVLLDWREGEGAPLDEAFAVEWLDRAELGRRALPTLANVELVMRLALPG